jgi:hypothetical protein
MKPINRKRDKAASASAKTSKKIRNGVRRSIRKNCKDCYVKEHIKGNSYTVI